MFSRRSTLGAVVAAPWLVQTAKAQEPAATPPTIEALARPPTVIGASLSPDGRTVGLLRDARDAKGGRVAYVSLHPADDLKKPPVRVVLGDFDVEGLSWANNARLLIRLFIEREADYTPTGSVRSRSYSANNRRILAVGVDGSNPVTLLGKDKFIYRVDPNLGFIVDDLPDDPQHVLMRAWDRQYEVYALHKVDVTTGDSEIVERGGPRTFSWHVSNGKPVLRWDTVGRSSQLLLARSEGETNWKPVRKIRNDSEFWRPDFQIVADTPEPGIFLATIRRPDDATTSIRTFDIRTQAVGPVVAARQDRDVDAAIVDSRSRFIGARYTADRAEYDFDDQELGAHFRGMDRFFQGEASVQLINFDHSLNRFLVRASGPRVANGYYLYDRTARKFEPLGLASPWLSAASLAPAELLDIKTRDGATIRAYLTVPLASGPRPLVVMPHGGPESRDSVTFDVFAQAFAAQGWLVLQPNFRGSGGHGRVFAEAGHRRWGDRMQEDVDDAVAQVLATGRADPKKVVIWGASYGGYSALMGAVRRPELYRCAVSVAGVSDLLEMLDYEREDGEDSPVYQYWLKSIGDPKTDADKLRQASPRHQAAAIAVPVLLIHGLEDGIVPPKQSKVMAQALRSAGKPVEYVELKDEGHRGWKPETLRAVLERSVDFIGKNI